MDAMRLGGAESSLMPDTLFRATKTPGVHVRHRARCPAAFDADGWCRCEPGVPRPATPSRHQRTGVVAYLPASGRGAQPDRRRKQGQRRDQRGGGPRGHPLGALGTVDRRRHKRRNRERPQGWPLQRDDAGRLPAILGELDRGGVRAPAGGRDRRGRVSGVGRQPGQTGPVTGVHRNPLRHVELPGVAEQPRLRIADAAGAEALLAALDADDQVLFALAFYAGLRRARRSPACSGATSSSTATG